MLENLEIHGSLIISGDNVKLRNVKIVSNGYWPVRVTGSGVVLEDTTIIGGDNSQASLAGTFTGRRLNLSGAGDGIKMSSNSVLEDSYIHDLAHFEGAHNDGIDADDATNIRVVHNTVLNAQGQTSAACS